MLSELDYYEGGENLGYYALKGVWQASEERERITPQVNHTLEMDRYLRLRTSELGTHNFGLDVTPSKGKNCEI